MKDSIRFNRYLVPILIIVCFCLYLFCWYLKSPVTTVILVRHADRTGSVDQLNTNGFARAQELSRVLYEANISAIYTSTFNRTQQTANPIATALGISVDIYDAGNIADLVEDITTNHKGEVILVVGHSNTVPETIGLLGISPVPPEIPHSEYNHMYLVTKNNKSIPRMIKMEYGNDTP